MEEDRFTLAALAALGLVRGVGAVDRNNTMGTLV